jgi:hypothetical protein
MLHLQEYYLILRIQVIHFDLENVRKTHVNAMERLPNICEK